MFTFTVLFNMASLERLVNKFPELERQVIADELVAAGGHAGRAENALRVAAYLAATRETAEAAKAAAEEAVGCRLRPTKPLITR